MTDNELLTKFIYGLGRHLRNPKEENEAYETIEGIGNHQVRRLMKLLVDRCGLPNIVDQWIREWQKK